MLWLFDGVVHECEFLEPPLHIIPIAFTGPLSLFTYPPNINLRNHTFKALGLVATISTFYFSTFSVLHLL
jgi:hypothetical protein